MIFLNPEVVHHSCHGIAFMFKGAAVRASFLSSKGLYRMVPQESNLFIHGNHREAPEVSSQ